MLLEIPKYKIIPFCMFFCLNPHQWSRTNITANRDRDSKFFTQSIVLLQICLTRFFKDIWVNNIIDLCRILRIIFVCKQWMFNATFI